MSDRIITLHPEGKTGKNIEKDKYEKVKEVILDILNQHEELSFNELMEKSISSIETDFDGSPGWYFATVKLDLEARKLIECQRTPKGQKIKIAK